MGTRPATRRLIALLSPAIPLLGVGLGLLAACAPRYAASPAPPVESLDPMLTPYRAQVPALAAAVVREGKVIAVGAVGTRRVDAQVPVTVNDRFHLGSNTKAFTALLAAMLVEEGKLRWDSTLSEVFPELASTMHPDVRSVTLTQLLSHSSGMAGDIARSDEIQAQSYAEEGNLDELRYWMVAQWLKEPLDHKPGTAFLYSNMGYVTAGVMVERAARASGKTWEELVMERIFLPLALSTAGFGPQASLGKTDAPVGHALRDGTLQPLLSGPNGDNPVVLGPAGTGHMSILDFATWAGWNAGEGRRGPSLVRAETLKKLHTPVIDTGPLPNPPPGTPGQGRYALGWVEITYTWASRPLLYHAGSNRMNLAHILVDPVQDFGMVLMTNVGGTDANRVLRGLEEALYRKFAISP